MDGGYKPSRYNVLLKDEQGRDVLVNTRSDRFCVLTRSECEALRAMDGPVEPRDDGSDNAFFEALINNGALVRADLNEYAVERHTGNKRFYAQDAGTATVVLTLGCNFDCPYCFQRESKLPASMSPEAEKRILTYIEREMALRRIQNMIWFGGEPLLELDRMLRMIHHIDNAAAKKGVHTTHSVVTNGYLLTPKTAAQLYENNVRRFMVTLDGIGEEHNETRRNAEMDSFDRIVSNLVAIRDNPAFRKLAVIIRSNITDIAVDGLDGFVSFCHNTFGSDKRFSFYFAPACNYSGAVEDGAYLTQEDEVLRRVERAHVERVPKASLMYTSPHCAACAQHDVLIMPDATLHKCQIALFNPELYDAGHIGTIGPLGMCRADAERESLWVGAHGHEDLCENCEFYPLCHGASCPKLLLERDGFACKKKALRVRLEELVKSLSNRGLIEPLMQMEQKKVGSL